METNPPPTSIRASEPTTTKVRNKPTSVARDADAKCRSKPTARALPSFENYQTKPNNRRELRGLQNRGVKSALIWPWRTARTGHEVIAGSHQGDARPCYRAAQRSKPSKQTHYYRRSVGDSRSSAPSGSPSGTGFSLCSGIRSRTPAEACATSEETEAEGRRNCPCRDSSAAR